MGANECGHAHTHAHTCHMLVAMHLDPGDNRVSSGFILASFQAFLFIARGGLTWSDSSAMSGWNFKVDTDMPLLCFRFWKLKSCKYAHPAKAAWGQRLRFTSVTEGSRYIVGNVWLSNVTQLLHDWGAFVNVLSSFCIAGCGWVVSQARWCLLMTPNNDPLSTNWLG